MYIVTEKANVNIALILKCSATINRVAESSLIVYQLLLLLQSD